MPGDDRAALDAFFDNPVDRPLLGIVYGRRRIGKSTLLVEQVASRGGFYFEAIRVETPVQLERLGVALGAHLGVGRLAFEGWEEAFAALIRLGEGADTPVPVVLDELGHILEADPSVESALTAALGPGAVGRSAGRARIVVCGSAISVMRALTEGEAPLRGRASLELVMQPDDFRVAATRLPADAGLAAAVRTFAVIGGVVGYATDMVAFDLPSSQADVDRWIVERVLSPAATLHREATTLLAEDPVVGGRNALLHHGILGAIANGSVTAGGIARRVGRPVSNVDPFLRRLIDAGFVVRRDDPVRTRRPLYALSDPFLQFHYAVLEPHGALLRGRDPAAMWEERLASVFSSLVRGPVFEEMARDWTLRFAGRSTVPVRDHIGPSMAHVGGRDRQIDVLVAGPGDVPGDRRVAAIGEAKAGEELQDRHLRALESVRASFGTVADGATLLLFGERIHPALVATAAGRSDVEIVDLERLYGGE